MSDEFQSNSDANQEEVSSELQSTEEVTNEAEGSSEGSLDQQASQQGNSDQDVFNRLDQHPRFKEVIEQKNAFAKELEYMKAQQMELMRRLSEVSQPKKQEESKPQFDEGRLIQELTEIKPEFGHFIKSLKEEISNLKNSFNETKTSSVRERASQVLDGLMSKNSVPESLRNAYRLEIQSLASQNPNLGLNDLETVFNQVHGNYSKFIDSIKKSERESYVKAKSKDASIPSSQPRGKAPAGKQEGFSSDPDVARQQTIDAILNEMKGSRSF